VGYPVIVELRNGATVQGTIVNVDNNFNIFLQDTIYRRQTCTDSFTVVFVVGRHIRYIHMPEDTDLRKVTTTHELYLEKSRSKYKRGKRRDVAHEESLKKMQEKQAHLLQAKNTATSTVHKAKESINE